MRSRNKDGALGDLSANVSGTISGGITGAIGGAAAGAQAGATGGDAQQAGAQGGQDTTSAYRNNPFNTTLRIVVDATDNTIRGAGQSAFDQVTQSFGNAQTGSPPTDNPVKVSATLGRGTDATTIAREATIARDFAMKTVRNPASVTVGVWDGAVQLEGAGGSHMVRKGESAALPEGGSKPVPIDGLQRTGLPTPGLRPDRVNADLAQVFEEDGRNFTGPGVYVQVREGAVELRKDGEVIVLQRGDSGFTDAGNGPLRKFTTPPPFLIRDPFLARGATRIFGSAGGGRMCVPAIGT
jgi:hypothetical protein